MEPLTLLGFAADDARTLLAAAETKWDRPVPHCPDWDAAGLVRHMGSVLEWIAAIVTSGERVSRRTLESPPENTGDLPAWYRAALQRNVDVLGSADPNSETWTFSSRGDHSVRWWCRRVAIEVAVHRWDAEHAEHAGLNNGAPAAHPIARDLAAVGIEEFVTEFLPGLVRREDVEGISGMLHLHGVDGPSEWFIDLDTGSAAHGEHGAAIAEEGGADTTVLGTRSDLLLWLMNRGPLGSLTVFGDEALLERWGQLEF
jgi:uncharacterized protein (TIGR03083 family)